MNYIRFRYNYYSIGQGLFSSGALLDPYKQKPKYLWVYDCGSASKGAFGTKAQNIDHSLDKLSRVGRKTETIDLLTLSHFDKDHVNGVVQLLTRFRVKILLLPYLGLTERLLIALGSESDGDTAEILDFLIDPASYLTEHAPKGIERIVFVPPSSGDTAPPAEGEYPPESPDRDKENREVEPRYFSEQKPPEDDTLVRHAPGLIAKSGEKTQVEYLGADTGITISPFWEFIPYNEKRIQAIPTSFKNQVMQLKDQLLNNSKSAIAQLRSLYDSTFGSDGPSRNDISLFLYCGPIYSTWRNPSIYGVYGGEKYMARRWIRNHRFHYASGVRMVSQLYTGDGYLDTLDRINALKEHLGVERWTAISVFQVMHHGSRKNWCPQVGPEFRDLCLKVCCSDPSHYGHPHQEVKNDLRPLFQVNLNPLTIEGRLYL
ncbi:hypothetical protein SH580_08800 [Coraliomargarita algicola]|uniref:Metallo-beta-lactamase domain-containing protein n=1 Tax=Coraliomargarita algicola TaxID=3092156 RepID=A0ABZ0RRD9_9BACT|nr:hypothetical protein [Coraliomargarita sp. J2-16]WPJ97809.1 hypothetical protein SH580_08800 [Coraliomargarita sp. J2-16]